MLPSRKARPQDRELRDLAVLDLTDLCRAAWTFCCFSFPDGSPRNAAGTIGEAPGMAAAAVGTVWADFQANLTATGVTCLISQCSGCSEDHRSSA